MQNFKEEYIKNYFISRDWKLVREGRLFNYLQPPTELNFPSDFIIEIPKASEDYLSFDNFITRLIQEIKEFLPNDNNVDDLRILFSKENSILKYRIFDAENDDGSISLKKHIESLDVFKRMLSQAVTFVSTKKPIFGNAKFEVESYLNRCRSLQTEKGSYVTKIEVPNDKIYSTVSSFDTAQVNNKLFDVLEFIGNDIFSANNKIDVNENYIQDLINYINYELFVAIRDIYSKPRINNVEYQLSNNKQFRKVKTHLVQPKLRFFNSYLGDLRRILIETVPLEATGFIKKLSSPAPLHSKKNEIIVNAEVANVMEVIKVILRSDEYQLAIEAHKNEWAIKIKGKARQTKTHLTIYEPDEFQVLKK
jgi:hypothetical protein